MPSIAAIWHLISFCSAMRTVLVHAKDEAACQWYESWEFEASPTDPFQLYLMIKDLKAIASV